MARLRIAGIAAAALVACGPTVGWQRQSFPRSEGTKTAVLSFGVIDGLGHGNLQGGKVKSFKELKTGRDLVAMFHLNRFLEEEARKVPFGHYDLVFAQPGFPDLERPVDISGSEVNLEVCVTTATVHLVPVYAFGKYSDLEAKVTSFRGDDYGLDLASRFKTNTATKVPYGSYSLRVENHGFDTLVQSVDVFQPEVWVLISPEVGSEGPAFPAPTKTLSGVLKNLDPSEQPIYVHLINIFPTTVASNAPEDAEVTVSGKTGTFTIAGAFSAGVYVLVAFGRSGILDLRKIDVTADYSQKSIVIDLGQKPKNAPRRELPN